MAVTRIFKTVVLRPGEAFTIPPDGEITFVSNALGLQSDCEVPPSENYVCKKLRWTLNDDSTPSPALEHQDSKVYSIFISDTEYVLDIDTHSIYYNNGGGASGDAAVQDAIDEAMPDGIFVIDHCGHEETGSRLMQDVHFYTFPSLVSTIKMKIVGPGYEEGLYIFASDGECNTIDLGS